ncbi:O-antigen ligase family protein [Legionella clemsonensis]|uniref:O-Antigen ligase n=1 Tax=Legionella clemsonensis TaxID=1867846 RepID=A0A222P3W4_9GAMM|nr:O-antigen ligase family protein [Legionella clemsonensis]ASQ46465.1 O-Antigen ligase [Legionella clemsonensis]
MLSHFLRFKNSFHWQASILSLLLLASLIFQGVTDLSVLFISYGLVLLLILMAYLHLKSQASLKLTPLSLLLIAWLLWISLPFSFGWVSNTALFGFFQCSPWVIVFFIFDLSSSTKRLWSVLSQVLWLLSLSCAVLALFQFFILHEMPCGFFASKNTAAAFLMVTLLILIGEFLNPTRNETAKLLHSFYLPFLRLSIFIIALAMFAALSRGVIISFACGFAIELILLRHAVSKKHLFELLILLLLTCTILLLLAQPAIAHRLALLQREKSRLVLWQGAWHLWQNTPWYGRGIFNFMHYYPAFSLPGDGSVLQYAHNDFLQLLIETGIPGGLILLGITGVSGLSFWRYLQQQNFNQEQITSVACFAAAMSMAFHSVVDFNFYVLIMNLLLGCFLGYVHNRLKKRGFIQVWTIGLSFRHQRFLIFLGLLLGLLISVSALRLFMLNYYITKADIAAKQQYFQTALHYSRQALHWLDLAELHSRRADLYLQLASNATARDEQQTFTVQTKQEINKAIAANPYFARPYFQMALVQSLLLNHQTQARHFFSESLAKDPHYSLGRLTFCQFLIEQQDFLQAQRILEQGLHYPIVPEQAEIYLNYLAKLRYKNGDKKGASQVVERLQHLSYYNNDYSDLV